MGVNRLYLGIPQTEIHTVADMILSNVLFVVVVVAFFAIADKLSGVNYRTHINPEEMK